MPKMTYEQAVEGLDNYLQKKTTHSTKDILGFMQVICSNGEWASEDDQTEFAQICANFDVWIRETGKTSIGRKQFEALWEKSFVVPNVGKGIGIDLYEDPLPTSLEDAASILEDAFTGVDNRKEAHDIRAENHRLRNELAKVREELKAANQKLDNIKGIILWG